MSTKQKKKIGETEVLHNTIYDDVFRTIVDKMPKLLIPVINEVFHTNYSPKEEIFKKDLVAFLPYYIMRYEKELPVISSNQEKLHALLKEYEEIRDALSEEMQENKESALFIDLIKLILRISDHFLASEEEIRKGVAEVMGGFV